MFSDYRPVTYWGQRPIYVTTLVLGICIFGLILGLIAAVVPLPQIPAALAFSPRAFWLEGQLWRAITYWFFDSPDFFSLFGLLFLWMYGKEVEQYLGIQRAFWFFGLMIVVPVLIASLFFALGYSSGLLGPYELCVATLVAFATFYPNVEIWGILRMKWLAWICVGLGSIGPLAQRDFVSLFVLWGECGAAFGYIRWLQLGAAMPSVKVGSLFRRKPKFRVVRQEDVEDESALGSVDQILEKISKHGIGSLTAKEKALLEKGRTELLKREKGK